MSGRIILILQQQIDRLIAENNELKKELSNSQTSFTNLQEECALWRGSCEQMMTTVKDVLLTMDLAIYNRTKK